jgi:hypothetical protein
LPSHEAAETAAIEALGEMLGSYYTEGPLEVYVRDDAGPVLKAAAIVKLQRLR